MEEVDNYVFKFVLIGPTRSGKSSILERFCEAKYSDEDNSPTIGIEFQIKIVRQDGINYTLKFWDTAGRDNYQTITKYFFTGAQGHLVVFDLTNREQFKDIGKYLIEINERSDERFKGNTLLIGNKVDLLQDRRVTYDEGMAMAGDHGVYYMETSAKTGEMVEDVFMKLTTLAKDKI